MRVLTAISWISIDVFVARRADGGRVRSPGESGGAHNRGESGGKFVKFSYKTREIYHFIKIRSLTEIET